MARNSTMAGDFCPVESYPKSVKISRVSRSSQCIRPLSRIRYGYLSRAPCATDWGWGWCRMLFKIYTCVTCIDTPDANLDPELSGVWNGRKESFIVKKNTHKPFLWAPFLNFKIGLRNSTVCCCLNTRAFLALSKCWHKLADYMNKNLSWLNLP